MICEMPPVACKSAQPIAKPVSIAILLLFY
jgi:hypothetical protein